MMLKGYRDAVIAKIKTAMPEFRDVDKHGGTFTEKQLKRYAVKAPACRVAFLDVENIQKLPTGEMAGPVKMAAYVIAEDRKDAESYDVALDLSEKLAGVIEGSSFDETQGGVAQVTGIQNLFTLSSEQIGITIAAVTFTAHVRFGVNTYLADTANDAPMPISLNELTMLGLSVEQYGPTRVEDIEGGS